MRVKFGLYEDVIKSGTGLYDYTQFREATVKKWLVKMGDSVKKGDVVMLVDSEKVELEIIALSDGVIVSLHYEEGEKWYQGDTEDTPLGRLVLPELGVMEIAGEPESDSLVSDISRISQAHDTAGDKTSVALSPLAAKLANAKNIPHEDLFRAYPDKRRIGKEDVEEFLQKQRVSAVPSQEETKHSVRADPSARRRARELGIELSRVSASREDGKIRVEDVEQYAKSQAHIFLPQETENQAGGETDTGDAEEKTVVHATEIRKTIARFLTQSHKIPHAGDEVTIDVSRIVHVRDVIREFWKKTHGTDLKYDHFIMYFAVRHLLLEPYKIINAYWDEEAGDIHYLHHVNLGIAVQTPQGLMVPVVHKAQTLSFRELVRLANDKVMRARTGKLLLGDYRGLSFTVNRVAFRGDDGRIVGGERPHAIIPWTKDVNGKSEGRPTSMILSLSKLFTEGDRIYLRAVFRFDHRIFDGKEPLLFIHALKDFIETSPYDDFSRILAE